MKQINKIAVALSALRCAAQSHTEVPQKAISPGQAQHTLIKNKADKQTASQLTSL